MNSHKQKMSRFDVERHFRALRSAFLLVLCLTLPELALAQDFESDACTFVGNISSLLTVASVAVVTIAIIFAGYQIAFAHKRISDVAPILIGGLLIGAAGQLAQWLLGRGNTVTDCTQAAAPGGGQAGLFIAEMVRYIG